MKNKTSLEIEVSTFLSRLAILEKDLVGLADEVKVIRYVLQQYSENTLKLR